MRRNLQCLIEALPKSVGDPEKRRIETSFQVLVLHTESAITLEMDKWIMLVNRPEFEVAV